MKRFIRRKFEAWLILLAAKILDGRNVNRCQVVSRRDNNDMRYMAEKLEVAGPGFINIHLKNGWLAQALAPFGFALGSLL